VFAAYGFKNQNKFGQAESTFAQRVQTAWRLYANSRNPKEENDGVI
jgi:hypothetical protein